jgi:hypothetical protein
MDVEAGLILIVVVGSGANNGGDDDDKVGERPLAAAVTISS